MKSLLFFLLAAFALVSCNSNESSSATSMADSTAAARAAKDSILAKNKQTALTSLEAFNQGNLDAFAKDMAPDAVDYGDGSAPPTKGVDSIKKIAKMYLAAFPDYHGANFLALADGNHVAVFGNWTGTFKGDLMGMKPTGKSFNVKDCDLFTFDDAGKMTEHRSVQSYMDMMSQVGAKMK